MITCFSQNIEEELEILSGLHGIGIILYDANETECRTFLPAAKRSQIDWQSVNRIAQENGDFRNFLRKVDTYFKTGNLELKSWNQ